MMRLNFQIPDIFDLTIGQYQGYTKGLTLVDKVEAISQYNKKELLKMPIQALREVCEEMDRLLELDCARFHRTLEIDGEMYGFIPEWADFTAGEFMDAEMFASDGEKSMNKLAAVLYRKVSRKLGDRYTITPYPDTEQERAENAELMKKMKYSNYLGMGVFFSTIQDDYANNIVQSTLKATREVQRLLKNGDGGTRSTSLLTAISRGWRNTLSYRSR